MKSQLILGTWISVSRFWESEDYEGWQNDNDFLILVGDHDGWWMMDDGEFGDDNLFSGNMI
jgi:hypothetical protein